MSAPNNQYKGHRFPPEIIQHAVWLYYRFNLSHRDIEDLLAARGIVVSYESVRLWCNKFGPKYAKRPCRRVDAVETHRRFRRPDRQRAIDNAVYHQSSRRPHQYRRHHEILGGGVYTVLLIYSSSHYRLTPLNLSLRKNATQSSI